METTKRLLELHRDSYTYGNYFRRILLIYSYKTLYKVFNEKFIKVFNLYNITQLSAVCDEIAGVG